MFFVMQRLREYCVHYWAQMVILQLSCSCIVCRLDKAICRAWLFGLTICI